MISSRRLSREWALKILYQMDVGDASLSEARDCALDRLRNEFVQLGSRNASGSTAELICLDYVTCSLSDTLATARPPFDNAVSLCIQRAFSEAPGWQDGYFEKAFKSKFKGIKLQPARMLHEDSRKASIILADAGEISALTDTETGRLSMFTNDLASHLPVLLAPEMRRTARKSVLDLIARRPNISTHWDSDAEKQILDERIRQTSIAWERWRKVAHIVQNQTTNWLRVGCFTLQLVNLLDQRRTEIDSLLTTLAAGWKLDRQVAVDRNILRLAALEMLFVPDIPLNASINEALELAKKFSTNESGRFINGVLGAVALNIGDKQETADRIAAPVDELIDDVMDAAEFAAPDQVDVTIGTSQEDAE